MSTAQNLHRPDIVWTKYRDTNWWISSEGEAFNRKNMSNRPWLATSGYLKIGYRLNRKQSCEQFLHRAVAELYVDGDTSLTVNHIDGNRFNNHPSNLEWLSNSDNVKHAHQMGLCGGVGEDAPGAKLTEADVNKICYLLDNGETHQSIADQFNVSKSLISLIHRGDRWNTVTNRKEIV